MRIFQVVPDLSYGDGIGNYALALNDMMRSKGVETKIYANGIDKRIGSNIADKIGNYVPQADDIVIDHIGVASPIHDFVASLSCKKAMIYHNITPPHFLQPYNKNIADYCSRGLVQVRQLKDKFDMVLTVSEFNKQDLISMGYKNNIEVSYSIPSFSDYGTTPNQNILKKYDDDYTNILFLGRIVPNKKQENIIRAFDFYQTNFNSKSRLFLVGSWGGFENYYEQLKEYVKKLGTKNVFFTGQTRFDEIIAYYTLSDLFLSMTEHEGFCLPLVEAMYFKIPILAYSTTAIPMTMGGGGFIMKTNEASTTAALMNRILTNEKLKSTIVNNQDERLKDFNAQKVGEQFWSLIKNLF